MCSYQALELNRGPTPHGIHLRTATRTLPSYPCPFNIWRLSDDDNDDYDALISHSHEFPSIPSNHSLLCSVSVLHPPHEPHSFVSRSASLIIQYKDFHALLFAILANRLLRCDISIETLQHQAHEPSMIEKDIYDV